MTRDHAQSKEDTDMLANKAGLEEVTAWDNKPRYMWVWDNPDMSDKKVMTVVFMHPDADKGFGRVLAVAKQDYDNAYKSGWFKHCAELRAVAEDVEEDAGEEVTTWDGRPRDMWVWNDNDMSDKHAAHVVFVYHSNEAGYCSVCTVRPHEDADAYRSEWFKHCAEIEEAGPMTNQELADWLAAGPRREWKRTWQHKDCVSTVSHVYGYKENLSDEPVPEYIAVRDRDVSDEWREAYRPVEGGGTRCARG